MVSLTDEILNIRDMGIRDFVTGFGYFMEKMLGIDGNVQL